MPAADALGGGALRAGTPLPEALAAMGAARKGVLATASMPPRRGRSSYLGDRVMGHADPGAEAVAIWLGAMADCLSRDH